MFTRLLVGLDGSAGAEAALTTALDLGGRFHATVVLATVTPTAGEAARAQALLDTAAARAGAFGLAVETAVAWGEPDRELLRLAEQAEAVVVGRRGRAHGAPGTLGDVTARIVRKAPTPVLVAGDARSACVKPVVAYDGGETSSNALALAARYAEAVGVGLDVVHVGADPDEAALLLARAGAFLSQQAVDHVAHHLRGHVTDAIVEHLVRSRADLLVAGAHGRRRSWSVGSHAEALLRATTVPVIIVR